MEGLFLQVPMPVLRTSWACTRSSMVLVPADSFPALSLDKRFPGPWPEFTQFQNLQPSITPDSMVITYYGLLTLWFRDSDTYNLIRTTMKYMEKAWPPPRATE